MKTDGTIRPATFAHGAGLLLCLLLICGLAVLLCVQLEAATPRAALLAAIIVTGSMMSAFVVTALSPIDTPTGPLLGIAFRTGMPAAALLMVVKMRPALAEAGFSMALLACFLPALAAETWFATRRSRTASGGPSYGRASGAAKSQANEETPGESPQAV